MTSIYLHHCTPGNICHSRTVSPHVELQRVYDGCITLEQNRRSNKGIALKNGKKGKKQGFAMFLRSPDKIAIISEIKKKE